MTRRIAGETIIVPVRSRVADLEHVYTLDEVGTFVWERLDGHTAVEDLVDALCSEYDVDRRQATKDTVDLLRALQVAGLVRECSQATG